MRMLAYGITADFYDDYLDIVKSTAIEILEHFTKPIWNVYHETYLRRSIPAYLQRLLDKDAERRFSRMVGSLDCMHWQWKNCPTEWTGQYIGHKGKSTIILEAVASYDTWIWNAFFGLLGSLNDINVLRCSLLFNDVYLGETPQVSYQDKLVGGVKCKKDHQYIMMTCIMLHNMIVEDEHDEDAAEPFDPNDIPTRPRKAKIYARPKIDTDVHHNPQQLNQFLRRYREVRCPMMNKNLQDDLVDHLWTLKLQADQNHQ
ncbi:uncharacterized protein LOC133716619 [Rosa rugosa]|uniref:uncharacterized protein LOC133716619 n=1 Tax=Rosa rugosa TaxID=74645 RepID=UPI002B400A44|nr:uncharacterized protein LOC133716619 [Rosa rugosa]